MNGRVEIDANALPEGQLVKVVLLDEEPVRLSAEEKAWLRETLEEARSGESQDAFDFLEELAQAR